MHRSAAALRKQRRPDPVAAGSCPSSLWLNQAPHYPGAKRHAHCIRGHAVAHIRKPLPHADQVDRMKRYVRRLRTELRHRYDEFFAATRGRRDCPLEVRLKSRQVDRAREAVALAEACLAELQRQEAMFYAPFKPGDRVLVDWVEKGQRLPRGHFLVVDVEPDRKTGFRYEVAELTKRGTMHKARWPHPLAPHDRIEIRASDLPVDEEGARESTFYRENAMASRELAYRRGQLDMFEPVKDYSGTVRSFRRRFRLPA